MKTHLNILLQIVVLLLLSHLSFSQEVEVNLGGNSTSDAFVVKDSSGNVLLKMDGAKNFGINSEQPDRIEIKEKNGWVGGGGFGGSSISITPGGHPENSGNINISSGWAESKSGDINISTSNSNQAGNINITTGHSNTMGGKITIGTQSANAGGDDIVIGASGWLNLASNSYEGITLHPYGYGQVNVIGSGTYTGSWTQASDERYKNNIKPLSDMMNRVQSLQPVEYEWNKEDFPENNFPDGNQIGLIAQEVEKLFPEIVAENKDGYKSIDYSKLSVLLLQAVKEQQNEMEKQADEIAKQSDEIAKQSDEINQIKSELAELKSMIMQGSNKFSSNDNLFKED